MHNIPALHFFDNSSFVNFIILYFNHGLMKIMIKFFI